MNKFYEIWIQLKYWYYKQYWKVKSPTKPSKFYGWAEINHCVLDQEAVCYGILMKEN